LPLQPHSHNNKHLIEPFGASLIFIKNYVIIIIENNEKEGNQMTKQEVLDWLEKAIIHIGEDFCSINQEYYLDNPMKDALLPFEFSITSGVSKAVILIKGADFVVKIPFIKKLDEDAFFEDKRDWRLKRTQAHKNFIEQRMKETNNWNYILTQEEENEFFHNFETENPEPIEDDYYEDLEGASNIDLNGQEFYIPDNNYCWLETIIYDRAVEEGLGAYFAQEDELGLIGDTIVYYQTRCTPMEDMDIDYENEEVIARSNKGKQFCDKLDFFCFNELWIGDFLTLYGEQEFIRLNNFLIRYDIDDLRKANIGYIDGAPVLFDYSGYRIW
jgi:hypothetical protein